MSSSAGVTGLKTKMSLLRVFIRLSLKVVEKTRTGSEGREKDEKINR
jgi:hypothetical protein